MPASDFRDKYGYSMIDCPCGYSWKYGTTVCKKCGRDLSNVPASDFRDKYGFEPPPVSKMDTGELFEDPPKRIVGGDPSTWSPLTKQEGGKKTSDGGSTSYYDLPPHATELRHLISYRGMSKSRGDVFKACYRLGEKEGADILYDLNKMKFFVEDLIEMYHRGERL
jgi:hypothetical protein